MENLKFNFIYPELTIPDRKKLQPASYIRKSFVLEKCPQKAILSMTALGVYEGYINGRRLDNAYFHPGFTEYRSRIQYQTYDVTDDLKSGENVIAAVLGDGWYRGCLSIDNHRCFWGDRTAFACTLRLEYENGVHEITTDESWKATQNGPVVINEMKKLEKADARLLMPGWNAAGFDDSEWHLCVTGHYGGKVVLDEGEPITEHEMFVPKVIQTPDGSTVLDFGQNHCGHVEFTVTGHAGTNVALTMGETLDEKGNFTLKNLVTKGTGAVAEDAGQRLEYTLREGTQTYKPQFLVSGYRYVKLENWPEEVKAENFRSYALYSDVPEIGTFTCSNAKINRLMENISWSRKSNFMDVPTDCPTRERAGWTGDINVFSESACYMTDPRKFLHKWLRDFVASQFPDGRFQNIIPNNSDLPLDDVVAGSAGWNDAILTIPMMLYRFFGDTEGIRIVYEAAGKYIRMNLERAKKKHPLHMLQQEKYWDYILDTGFHYGEWLEPGTSPISSGLHSILTPDAEAATAWLYYAVKLYSEMSGILGIRVNEDYYHQISLKIKDAYRKVFLKDGKVHSSRQCRYVRPISLGLTNKVESLRIASALAAICRKNHYRIGTGFLTTYQLLPALCDNGQTDTAYRILLNEQCPGWLYEVDKGATTIWENWLGIDENNVPQDSLNHYAMGSVAAWLYGYCAGIRPEAPGFAKVLIRPYPGGGLTSAEATYQSVRGKIVSSWKIDGDTFRIHVEVPADTDASLRMPDGTVYQVKGTGDYSCHWRKRGDL